MSLSSSKIFSSRNVLTEFLLDHLEKMPVNRRLEELKSHLNQYERKALFSSLFKIITTLVVRLIYLRFERMWIINVRGYNHNNLHVYLKKKRRKQIQNSPQTDGFCACLIIEIFSNNTGECLKLLAGID